MTTLAPRSVAADLISGPSIDTPSAWPGDLDELLRRKVREFEDAETTTAEARELSERDRDYLDHKQWTPEEMVVLKDRHQPPSVNNIIARKIELLKGIERRGRSDPEAYPRTPSENTRADAATQALRYAADENRFDVIRSLVYENLLVEGYGGAEVIVEPDDSGEGYDVVVNQIPWERIYFDPHSQHPGFTDARYLGVVIWMDHDEAIEKYPGCEDILAATMDYARSNTFDDKPRFLWSDRDRRRVRVCQHYWKRGRDWWIGTFTRGGFLDAPMPSPYIDRHNRRSCPLILRSGKIDRDNNRYGVVRGMISMQDGVNKRESKLQHSLAVNQIIMEQGAVADEDKARREVAKPDGLIVVRPGAKFEIRRDEGEIAGHFQLLQHAIHQLDLMGPNAAMSGKDPREQSGRAILAQQAGGMAENEPMADALRQWTHKIFESMWMRIRQFWVAEKWIRVTDNDRNATFVGLNHPVTVAELLSRLDKEAPLEAQLRALPPRDAAVVMAGMRMQPGDPRLQTVVRTENDIGDMDVSITVEEGPDNPTMQAEQFQQLMQLPPQILMQFPPSLIIEASSLRGKDKLIKMLEDHQKQTMQGQQGAQAMARAQVAKVQADAADKKASALVRMHGIASDHAAMPMDQAQRDADMQSQHVGNLSTLHGMAMDHAALPMQQGQQAAAIQSRGVNDAATAHGMLLDTHAALNPPQPAAGPSGPQSL